MLVADPLDHLKYVRSTLGARHRDVQLVTYTVVCLSRGLLQQWRLLRRCRWYYLIRKRTRNRKLQQWNRFRKKSCKGWGLFFFWCPSIRAACDDTFYNLYAYYIQAVERSCDPKRQGVETKKLCILRPPCLRRQGARQKGQTGKGSLAHKEPTKLTALFVVFRKATDDSLCAFDFGTCKLWAVTAPPFECCRRTTFPRPMWWSVSKHRPFPL